MPQPLPRKGIQTRKEMILLKRLRKEGAFHLMLLPCLVLLIIFAYLPMYGIRIAFQDFIPAKGMFGEQTWVGLDNFRYIFSMPDTINIFRNTLVIAIGKIIGLIIVPVFAAIVLSDIRNSALQRVAQTIISFPHFISWVIMSAILTRTLSSSGIVNMLITAIGLPPVNFLTSNQIFPYTMIFTEIWKEFGFSSIIYLAAITSIDPALYEAARVDGANRFQLSFHITLPSITPIIVLMCMLSLGNVLNAGFDQIFNMQNSLVMDWGDIIDTFVYRIGLVNFKYGISTAMGLFKSVISFGLISGSYFLAYKFADYRVF